MSDHNNRKCIGYQAKNSTFFCLYMSCYLIEKCDKYRTKALPLGKGSGISWANLAEGKSYKTGRKETQSLLFDNCARSLYLVVLARFQDSAKDRESWSAYQLVDFLEWYKYSAVDHSSKFKDLQRTVFTPTTAAITPTPNLTLL